MVVGYAWSSQAKTLSGAHALLRGAIFVYVALQVVALLAVAAMLYVFWLIGSGGALEGSMGEMLGNVMIAAGIYLPIASIAVLVGCIIAYSMFVYRGMKNLHLSGVRSVTTSPGWAVGWSFIPIANLGMIFNVMKQIWVGSHDPVSGKYDPPATLGLWWGCWIASGVIGRFSEVVAPKDATLQVTHPSEYLSVFMPTAVLSTLSGVFGLISCFCLLAIIKQILSAQETLRSTAAFEA